MAEPQSHITLTVAFDPFNPPPWARELLLLLAEGGATPEAADGRFEFVARGRQELPDPPEVEPMSFTIAADEFLDLKATFADRRGNPAVVDGVPVYASSDDTVATVAVSPDDTGDGLLARVTAAGPLGSAQITATADADLDTGETRELIVTGVVTVVAGEAVAGTFQPAGEPQPIP